MTRYKEIIRKLKNTKGPIVCEIFANPNSQSLFKQGYKTNLDGTFAPMELSEMYPFVNSPVANTNN